MVSFIFKKFIIFFLFISFFLSIGFAYEYITEGDCHSSDVSCVFATESGEPDYSNEGYMESNMSFDKVSEGLLNLIVFYNTSVWDPITQGPIYTISGEDGKTYNITQPFYFLEKKDTEPLDLSYVLDIQLIKYDFVVDNFDSTYFLLELKGIVNITDVGFINQGTTVIAEGARVNYKVSDELQEDKYHYDTPSFYAEVLVIGGEGGYTQFNTYNNLFVFKKIYMQNAKLAKDSYAHAVSESIIKKEEQRYISLYGNTELNLRLFQVSFVDMEARINITMEGDNNVWIFDNSSFAWGVAKDYNREMGAHFDISCTTICTNNAFYVNQDSSVNMEEVLLHDITEFNINTDDQGINILNIQDFYVENSSVVANINGRYNDTIDRKEYSALGFATHIRDSAIFTIDENSSFIANLHNGSLGLGADNLLIMGNFEVNMTGEAVVNFSGTENQSLTTNDVYIHASDSSYITSVNGFHVVEGNLYIDNADNSTISFYKFYLEDNGNLYIDLIDETSFTVNTLTIDTSDEAIINFSSSAIGKFTELNVSQGSLNINMKDAVVGTFTTVNITGGETILNFDNTSNGTFENLNVEDGKININFTGDTNGNFENVNLTGGDVHIDMVDKPIIIFSANITGSGGEMFLSVKNNTLVHFQETDIDGAKVNLAQEAYTHSGNHTLLRFDKVSTFLDDEFIYSYTINYDLVKIDLNSKELNTKGVLILMQIKNDGPAGDFPEDDEEAVIAKINAAGSGLEIGGDGGNDSISVLIHFEPSGDGTGGDASLVDYIDIGGVEYAEFGLGAGGGTYSYVRAQDQYGEEAGLLTLTTIENMDGYEIAVVFDNVVFRDTDTSSYRTTIFNLVINNSRTVKQLGNTLNSLGANISLSNIIYSSSILEQGEKKNATTLFEGQRFNSYAEVRNLSSSNFSGNYLAFGASLMFFATEKFRFGISGFYSPYKSTTAYDAEETSGNTGVELYGAMQVGEDSGAIMFDVSIMHSEIEGKALATMGGGENARDYLYAVNSNYKSISYNFGEYYGQRIVLSSFARGSQSYIESGSELVLNVVTPSYNGMFLGYYSKVLNTGEMGVEVGLKYYLKENQKEGTAFFIEDIDQQQWAYQYALLKSKLELSVDVSYTISQNLQAQVAFNKRGSYNNFGLYIMYKKELSVGYYYDTGDDGEAQYDSYEYKDYY